MINKRKVELEGLPILRMSIFWCGAHKNTLSSVFQQLSN